MLNANTTKISPKLKGLEAKWANPELNVGNCPKSSKMDIQCHCTLPSCQIFQKIEFSIAHKTHFKHVFKIRGAKSTFVG